MMQGPRAVIHAGVQPAFARTRVASKLSLVHSAPEWAQAGHGCPAPAPPHASDPFSQGLGSRLLQEAQRPGESATGDGLGPLRADQDPTGHTPSPPAGGPSERRP
eukprot:15379303-Alexandrium_andersonii.AAC.1